MKCFEIEELLGDLIDNELDVATHKNCIKHIESCPTCSKAFNELKHLKTLVRGFPDSVLSSNFDDDLQAKVASIDKHYFKANSKELSPPKNNQYQKTKRTAPFAIAASVVLLSFLVIFLFSQENHVNSSPVIAEAKKVEGWRVSMGVDMIAELSLLSSLKEPELYLECDELSKGGNCTLKLKNTSSAL
ncbi:zf-HC2 domain-containing protein [Colwellia sp. D2M02]|uniref:anti-sigma factor family protein n=1 Tax=Colwellia sp. D2M02 TaxID=2841562 RepID=UPI001C092229|nr:zf-HC2 domain-containing protein [Colwellia sp. D2M02]MBU2893183.1 zf-HC2 domain-containing protein [Colwellia sp. D2M02]